MSGLLHNKLKRGYTNKPQIASVLEGEALRPKGSDFDQVPDLTDYSDLWLSLQLFAAKRTQVM